MGQDIAAVQRSRKHWLRASGTLMLIICFLVASAWPSDGWMASCIEDVGLLLIVVGIGGRAWCSLYISGRKIDCLVVAGPYSLSRNPLYLFTYIAVAGMAAQSGSLVLIVVALLVVHAIFGQVIGHEEGLLSRAHGAAYRTYTLSTPRLWPRFSAWQDVAELPIRPKLVARSVADGSLFLLAWPLFELLEHLRTRGVLEPIATLP